MKLCRCQNPRGTAATARSYSNLLETAQASSRLAGTAGDCWKLLKTARNLAAPLNCSKLLEAAR
eukprot:15451243-Alexandrium_andersonii.AAC.1